jgi:hypothetical protein
MPSDSDSSGANRLRFSAGQLARLLLLLDSHNHPIPIALAAQAALVLGAAALGASDAPWEPAGVEFEPGTVVLRFRLAG